MKQFLATLSLVFSLSSFISLTACGDDSSTSVSDEDSSSSNTVVLSSSSSQKGTEPAEVSSSSKKNTSSSSWSEAIGSSNSKPSSSSKTVVQSSSSVTLSATSVESNGSSAASSSSEYVPFDHSKTLAAGWRIGGDDRYKQFTDPRNGRSYYYITITSVYSGDSVTVMAENLNIGEMVLGKDDQNDDTKIERYCYNNDTTKCDEFGGLYQWAEMMQLPSRCNTESCSDLIRPNHQGICPDGWRLMTYDDFVVIEGYKDEFGYGIKGLRSAYGFGGNNYSGFSLTGAGYRTKKGGFESIRKSVSWFYPEEYENEEYKIKKEGNAYAGGASALNDYAPNRDEFSEKILGNSVRCVKVEQ